MPTTPERRTARTSGAGPSYSKVVPAPELLAQRRRYKLDGNDQTGLQGPKRPFSGHYWFGTSRITGPRGAGAAGAAGAMAAGAASTLGLGGLPYWPIGPNTTATASTTAATIAPKMPPTDSDDIPARPRSRSAVSYHE